MAKKASRGRLYVGTSSWVERNLIASRRFYPPDVKASDARLAFYAERFNLAEIDSTYYALPPELLKKARCYEKDVPPAVAVTAGVAAVRFRGRNAGRWEDKSASADERLDWLYTDEELREWLPRIERLADEAEEVYCAFNTKAEDQGVANAARLQKLLVLP
jgi:uncharacterized protein YecE (DUF72 family)